MMLGAQITRSTSSAACSRGSATARQQRAAQRLPHRRRRVGRRQHVVAVDRRAGHASRRACRTSIDEPWFATGHRGPSTPTSSTTPWLVDRGPSRRRGDRRLRGGPGGDRPGVRRTRRDGDPQYAAIGTMPPSTTTSSARSRCRTCCSACPSRRDRSAGPAARTAPTPPRCSPRSASRRRARRPPRARHRVSGSRAPIVTGLYVPGDRPERFAKAVATGAQLVILDLEDAVAPDRKDAARSTSSSGWRPATPADDRRGEGQRRGHRRPRGAGGRDRSPRPSAAQGRVAARHRAALAVLGRRPPSPP